MCEQGSDGEGLGWPAPEDVSGHYARAKLRTDLRGESLEAERATAAKAPQGETPVDCASVGALEEEDCLESAHEEEDDVPFECVEQPELAQALRNIANRD